MKKNILSILAAIALTAALAGCSANEPSPDSKSTQSKQSSVSSSNSISLNGTSTPSSSSDSSPMSSESSASPASSAESSSSSTSSAENKSSAASSSVSREDLSTSLIPDAVQTARVEGDRIIFSVENVFSNGEYYEVRISGAKCENQSASVTDETTYINGVLYGDFRLDLYKTGVFIDSLRINVPRDDNFLILENAAIGKDYGCSIMSHKREFSVDKYPDIIRLEFFHIRGTAVPQYARYFAVFDNKIQELEIYENGKEVSPVGTFLTMRGDGLMTQNLTVEKLSPLYKVITFEYRFNLEKRRLDRTEVNFPGWGN